jgi:hypothetical protein
VQQASAVRRVLATRSGDAPADPPKNARGASLPGRPRTIDGRVGRVASADEAQPAGQQRPCREQPPVELVDCTRHHRSPGVETREQLVGWGRAMPSRRSARQPCACCRHAAQTVLRWAHALESAGAGCVARPSPKRCRTQLRLLVNEGDLELVWIRDPYVNCDGRGISRVRAKQGLPSAVHPRGAHLKAAGGTPPERATVAGVAPSFSSQAWFRMSTPV